MAACMYDLEGESCLIFDFEVKKKDSDLKN